MGRNGWLARGALVARTRVLHGSPHEDERTRHGRAAGALLVLGAGSGIALLPVLPARIDHLVALALAVGCLVLGLVAPWLPWERWPRQALLAPVAVALPVIFVGGGVVDHSLDYYALYFPLVFIYLGLVFPPAYCVWTFAACLLGVSVSVAAGQSADVVPFVLLGAVLSAITGGVLAVQRRAEAQGYDAMRALAEAATLLGAATDRQQVADVVAQATSELLRADEVEVLLVFDTPEPAAVAAHLGGAPSEHDEAAEPVLSRARQVLASLGGRSEPAAPGRDAAAPPTFRLVVAIPGPAGPRGAIVVEQHRRAQGSDRFAARSLDVLAGEAGQVLNRLRRTEELVTSARTDALTGLGNRLVLDEAMERSAPGDVFILVDLDHFKRVNDTLGHAMGDRVLVAFAGVLRAAVRLDQVVVRYGGEEFATILPQADQDATDRHLRDVRRAWAALHPEVTFSSGIAVRAEGEPPAATLARADRALYRAKSGGRDRDVHDRQGVLGAVPAQGPWSEDPDAATTSCGPTTAPAAGAAGSGGR